MKNQPVISKVITYFSFILITNSSYSTEKALPATESNPVYELCQYKDGEQCEFNLFGVKINCKPIIKKGVRHKGSSCGPAPSGLLNLTDSADSKNI